MGSFKIFKLMASIGLDTSEYEKKVGETKESTKGLSSHLGSSLAKGVGLVAKGTAMAIGAAATGIATLITESTKSYAEYEQLVGGVETLFKDSAGKVQEYAAQAYKTTGLSANEYMENVTSFSASLLQSLGGDTAAAAEYANMAMIDMSDNANKMGTNMESITVAYQGFAKQNYTMLDNLKLGYGGTKEEMARLIADAAKLDSSIDANDMSFQNIVKSIHAVQENMGIAGTTTLEASKTISGSVQAMKSAWKNLVTGMADENADFEVLVDDFVETVGVTAENIIPRVEVALEGAGKLVDRLVPIIIDKIPQIVTEFLPKILNSGVSIIKKLLQGIMDNQDVIAQGTVDTVMTFIDGITDMLPDIIVTGVLLLGKLAVGIIQAIPDLVLKIPEIIEAIVKGFADNMPSIVQIGKDLVSSIKNGILEVWDGLVSWFNGIWDRLFGGRNVNVNVNKSESGVDGSHASGLRYVPFDGYIAELHKGERVLTADEAKDRDRPRLSVVQNIYSEAKTAADLMLEAVYHMERAEMVGV